MNVTATVRTAAATAALAVAAGCGAGGVSDDFDTVAEWHDQLCPMVTGIGLSTDGFQEVEPEDDEEAQARMADINAVYDQLHHDDFPGDIDSWEGTREDDNGDQWELNGPQIVTLLGQIDTELEGMREREGQTPIPGGGEVIELANELGRQLHGPNFLPCPSDAATEENDDGEG